MAFVNAENAIEQATIRHNMTLEEFNKLPFHFNSHLSMVDEYRTTYVDDNGRLAICECVPLGRSRKKPYRVFCIDGTWYEKQEEFEKALKRFGFGPQQPKKGGQNK